MNSKQLYEHLGLNETASHNEIVKAFRTLSRKYHPDLHPGDKKAEEMFKKIAQAYGILSDPEKKEKYDRYGDAGLAEMGSHEGMDPFAEIFRHMHGMGGMKKNQTPAMQIPYTATLEEVFTQGICKVTVPKNEKCNDCNATGFIDKQFHPCRQCKGTGIFVIVRQQTGMIFQQQTTCPKCRGNKLDTDADESIKCKLCLGKGTMVKNDEVEFQMPADVIKNPMVIVKGKGPWHNGQIIDLAVIIKVKMSKEFSTTNDKKLLYTHHLNFTETICGFTKIIDHPSGKKISIKSDPGYIINPDNIYMLDGFGFPSEHSSDVMYITFVVQYPESITLPSKKVALSYVNLEKVCGPRKYPNDDDSDINPLYQFNLRSLAKINQNIQSDYDSDDEDNDHDNMEENGMPDCVQQ